MTNFFLKILNETGHPCFMLESDTMLVYGVHDTVDEVLENLKDIRDYDDKAELMLQNIKFLSETVEFENLLTANTMKIKAEATSVSFNNLQKLNKMSKTERLEPEKKITQKTKTFVLNNVKQGKKVNFLSDKRIYNTKKYNFNYNKIEKKKQLQQ